MNRLARLAALALPLAGLAGLWAQSDAHYRSGTEWEVPIMGYDPRDYLRGHYVEFTYDWPGLAESDIVPASLCLEGQAPVIARVTTAGGQTCAHPLRAGAGDVYGGYGLTRGRLYLDQYKAAMTDAQLRDRDQRGIVTIRQREDGSFTPVSIRFRPLTPEEIAARDAQTTEAEDLRPPPPIMSQ